jgi:hypothetical protein
VNIFHNPSASANLTRHYPHPCDIPNVSPRSAAPGNRISIQYFWGPLAIPEKLKSRIISNLEISIQYFWTPSARKRVAAINHPTFPISTIPMQVAATAPPFPIFSFPFSSSAKMAP